MTAPGGRRETPDVETASDDYTMRFKGDVGRWFLEVQADRVERLLCGASGGTGRVLEVGAGHAQLAPVLTDRGRFTVFYGSTPETARRLRPWLYGSQGVFVSGDLLALPFADRTFDVVVAIRLLPHLEEWRRFVGELCRVATRTVIVEFPAVRSVNIMADRLFALKQGIEGNTRPYRVFQPRAIRAAFEEESFRVKNFEAQFLLPMALYRALGSAILGRALEAPARWTGITRWLGSPIIMSAQRSSGA